MQNKSMQINEIAGGSKFSPIKHKIAGLPEKLYYIGIIEDTSKFRIAVVGTRKATKESIMIATEISSELSQRNINIVSGLAIGIDSSAHRGALSSGGKTWAVLGNGIDTIYPKSNTNLANEIINSGGAIISEYPANSPIYPSNFIERNKIICAISDAIVVVQAPIKSGAVSTALFALKYNIPVFVIPGSIKSYDFAGSNQLIRKGAKLITGWKDILDDMGIKYNKNDNKIEIDDTLTNNILNIMKQSGGALDIDNIVQNIKLNQQTVLSKLSEMEINNLIEKSGNKYILK